MKFTHLIPGAAGAALLLCASAHAAAAPSAYAFYNAHTLPASAFISIDERELLDTSGDDVGKLPFLSMESPVPSSESPFPENSDICSNPENPLPAGNSAHDIGLESGNRTGDTEATGSNYAEDDDPGSIGEEV